MFLFTWHQEDDYMSKICTICNKPMELEEEMKAGVHFECQNRVSGDAEEG